MAKRTDSRYVPGERSSSWQKLKLDRQQEFVIGGYRPGTHGVDALLVGYHERKQLRFAGKVRAGFYYVRDATLDVVEGLPDREELERIVAGLQQAIPQQTGPEPEPESQPVSQGIPSVPQAAAPQV